MVAQKLKQINLSYFSQQFNGKNSPGSEFGITYPVIVCLIVARLQLFVVVVAASLPFVEILLAIV
jgi:hypothetical protein